MDVILFLLLGAAVTTALYYARWKYFDFPAQVPEDYEAGQPQFDLREHLKGPITCEGVIFGPTGRVSSRFVADFDAHWEGNVGVMKEHFRYDSGSTQDREWRLTVGNDGAIKADADDLVEPGVGMQRGSAVQLKYRIRLPESSGGHVLDTTDWMYLVENGSIINKSQFRKYGFKVAELVATMRRKDAA
ncbi:MAG: DUF3833 family protein [Pseudomonadota bacterium]